MNRYYWILMTYVKRPQIWLLSLVTIIFALAAVCLHSEKYQAFTPEVIRAGKIIESRDALLGISESPTPYEVQLRVSRIADDNMRPYLRKNDKDGNPNHSTVEEMDDYYRDEVDTLPWPENVVAIDMGNWGERMLPKLAKMKSIKRLEFEHASSTRPIDLSPLSNLSELEILSLGYLQNVDSLTTLRTLPKLHTLEIQHIDLLQKEYIAEVAMLPALKKLYLPDTSKFDFALEAIEDLNQSKSLQTVYVSIPQNQPEKIDAVQKRIPSIKVRSNKFRPYRLVVFAASIWFALIASIIGMHFSSQFHVPQAQLVPNYKPKHQIIVWTIILCLVGLCVFLTSLLGGAYWWPAAAAIGLTLVLSIRSSVISMRLIQKPSRLAIVFRFVGIGAVLGLALFIFKHPLPLEDYLLGKMPIVASAMGLCALVFSVLLKRDLDDACRKRYAAGTPLVISMADIQRAANRNTARVTPGSQKPAIDLRARLKWISLSFGGLLLVAVLLKSANVVGFLSSHPLAVPQLSLTTGLILMWITMFITAKWWMEMPYLARLIPRPPTRDSQIQSILFSVGKDFLFHCAPVAIAGVILAATSPIWSGSGIAVRATTCVCFAVSLITTLYAGTLWSLLIRKVLGVALLLIAIPPVVIFFVVIATIGGQEVEQGVFPYRVLLTSTVLIGVAIFAIHLAKQRFQRLEWAKVMT